MRLLIAVTHLLGTGHLARALVLGRAFADAGWQARVVSGGRAVPHLDTAGVEVIQLPPVHVEGTDFGTLLGPAGPVDAGYMAARQAALLDALEPGPDVLLTELFPFGRRTLRAEFTALLEAAQGRGVPVFASVRDILAPPSKPERADWTAGMVARFYSGVLVHSDPDLVPLEASWPVTPALAARLRYTGFVAPPPSAPVTHGAGEVLVTAGGGAVGRAMFEAAAEAAAADPARTWRCLTRMDLRGPANLVVEPPRPDFRAMLHGAAASVSMCGYNTALDLVQSGVPSVLVPFDAGGEVEQGLRARALSRRAGFAVVPSAELCGGALLDAVARVQAGPRRAPVSAGMTGAARSVQVVQEALGAG